MKTIYDNVELCGIGLMQKGKKKRISNESKINYSFCTSIIIFLEEIP